MQVFPIDGYAGSKVSVRSACDEPREVGRQGHLPMNSLRGVHRLFSVKEDYSRGSRTLRS